MSIQTVTYSAILGVVLSNLRKQQSIEQGKMAELMGLSQASYSRLEAGKATFSIDQMYQATIALDVSITDIVSRIETYSKELKAKGYAVEPQIRGNTTQASKSETSDATGKVIAGAALGALVMALLSG